MSSNYPPGVTGNEPQITGEISPEEIEMSAITTKKDVELLLNELVGMIEDAGAPSTWVDDLMDASEKVGDVLSDIALRAESAGEPPEDDRDPFDFAEER
jgi:hypothetical protein